MPKYMFNPMLAAAWRKPRSLPHVLAAATPRRRRRRLRCYRLFLLGRASSIVLHAGRAQSPSGECRAAPWLVASSGDAPATAKPCKAAAAATAVVRKAENLSARLNVTFGRSCLHESRRRL